jgi:hypothetical protein
MTEAVFAGARVGPGGVSPDSSKLTAVVNWKVPEDASHLEGFLGLTAYFRDLVKGYAALEKPLRDLLCAVDIPNGTKKSAYQRIMKAYKLQPHWKPEHTATFLNLKARLVSEPILTAPQFDGTHFILTTDACKDAFAGVLSQKIKTTLPRGKEVTRLHPIGFTSKRTSSSEEKYKPFLLEFAALKYSFDKFSDIVYGFPVEVETDCQALCDILLSDKLSATHARWRDGVLAHNIVDVRHIPGKINIADGVSRQYEGMDKIPGDGSEWTVTPDWEEITGLIHDLYQVAELPDLTVLKERFKEEPLYLDVIDAILGLSNREATVRKKKCAQHRKTQYMLDDGKLWFIGGGSGTRARDRRECVSRAEAVELAKLEHEQSGHWHRNVMKLALLDRYHSPKLDESIIKAIMDCARCKNFGGTHLHSLLQPITHRVKASRAGVVDFKKGQLVQVYQNKVASTLSTERKLAPMWSPPHRIAERLLNSYKLETLEGTTLDGLFHARRLRDFILREGTTLAIAQKKLEEALASGELEKSDIVAPTGGTQEELDYKKAGNREWGNSALEGSEEEGPSGEEGEGNAGFFYEDEGDGVPEEEESGIGARVAARRRGHLHNGGGQME